MNEKIDYVEMLNALFHGGNYRISVMYLQLAKQAVKAKWGFYPTVVMDDGKFAIIRL